MAKKYFVLYNEESGKISGFKVSSIEPEATFIEVSKDEWEVCFTKRALYQVENGALVLKSSTDKMVEIEDAEQRKVQILNTLKTALQEVVYEYYPSYKQANITLGLLGDDAKEELESFLESVLSLYESTKEYINSLEELDDLKQIDFDEFKNMFRNNLLLLVSNSKE